MTTRTSALAIDETTLLDVNGSHQRVRLCAERPGLPPLLIVQHGPGVPLLHEVSKFQRRLRLERNFLVVYWEQRGCGNTSADAARGQLLAGCGRSGPSGISAISRPFDAVQIDGPCRQRR